MSSQGASATTRNFDLIIALKGGSSHQFTNVMRYANLLITSVPFTNQTNRQEFQSLCNYFKAKEIKIKGLNNVSATRESDDEGQGREARKVAQAAVWKLCSLFFFFSSLISWDEIAA